MFQVLINGVYHPSDNLPPNSTNKKTIERRERRKRSKMNCLPPITCSSSTNFCLAPLPKAVPCVPSMDNDLECYIRPRKEEGKTPMRYNDNYASASANVTTVQSDAATQRDYLLSRLSKAEWPKQQSFVKLFNLHVDNTPKTYKDMIDAIKGDKYTIDPKIAKKLEVIEENSDNTDEDGWYWGAFHGIIWDGPKPDAEGYKEALKGLSKQATAAKDIIMTGDATAGLKALQDFEAWLPIPAGTTSSASVN